MLILALSGLNVLAVLMAGIMLPGLTGLLLAGELVAVAAVIFGFPKIKAPSAS